MAEADDEAPGGVQLDLMVTVQEGEPISDKELWACANHVFEQFGEEGLAHIRERIKTLTEAADAGGVLAWRSIADRYDQLLVERLPAYLRSSPH